MYPLILNMRTYERALYIVVTLNCTTVYFESLYSPKIIIIIDVEHIMYIEAEKNQSKLRAVTIRRQLYFAFRKEYRIFSK